MRKNFIGKEYIELLTTKELTVDLIRENEQRSRLDSEAIVLGKLSLDRYNYIETKKSNIYASLVRAIVVKGITNTGKQSIRCYFNVPVVYSPGYFISPHNPNLAVSNKDIIDINTDKVVYVFKKGAVKAARYRTFSYKDHTFSSHVLKLYAMRQTPRDLYHRHITDHIDQCRVNNNIDNLRYVTSSGNSVGPGNMENDGVGVMIEVLDTFTGIETTHHSLRGFMEDMGYRVNNVSAIFKSLSKGLYKDRYIWRTDKQESYQDVMRRCAKITFDVYKNKILVNTVYSVKKLLDIYHKVNIPDKRKLRMTQRDALKKVSKDNPDLTFKSSGAFIPKVISSTGYVVYNPVTKHSVECDTLRGLSRKMGWNPTTCIGMFSRGNSFVNSNGYICAEVGNVTKATNYSHNLDKHFFKGKEYPSIRAISRELGVLRRVVHLENDYRVELYKL